MRTVKFLKLYKEAFFPAVEPQYTVLAAGRRTGKTYHATIWLLTKILQSPNSSALWVDTTQSNIDKYYERYFYKILHAITGKLTGTHTYNRVSKILRLPNGSYIDFKSAERPENIEGFEYDYGVLNEAGIILRDDKLWYNTLIPVFKNATVKIVGTPKGRNLFYKLYLLGIQENGDATTWKSFRFGADMSPLWTKEQLEKIKEQVPAVAYRQEFLAEFVENESVVFSNMHACVEDYPLPVEPDPRKLYFAGLDLAKEEDYTVLTIMDDGGRVVYIDRHNKQEYTLQVEKVVSALSNYNARLLVDATGVGNAVYDFLKRRYPRIEGFRFSAVTKKDLIESLILGFESRQLTIPRHDPLLRELEAFTVTVPKSGIVRYSAPDGLHDDCVISLALAFYLYKEYMLDRKGLQISIFTS